MYNFKPQNDTETDVNSLSSNHQLQNLLKEKKKCIAKCLNENNLQAINCVATTRLCTYEK